MSWVATAIGGAALVSGGAAIYGANRASSAAKNAANTQADAADRASELQYQMFSEQMQAMEPWRQTGYNALSALSDVMGLPQLDPYMPFGTDAAGGNALISPPRGVVVTPSGNADTTWLRNNRTQPGYSMDNFIDPSYAWRKQEGINALMASGAASGSYGSGNLGVALEKFGQDYASNEYQNAFNRLASIAGIGQTTNQNMASLSATTSNNIGQNMITGANALATGQIGAANANAGAINNVSNQLMSGVGTYMNYMQNQNLLDMLTKGNLYKNGVYDF